MGARRHTVTYRACSVPHSDNGRWERALLDRVSAARSGLRRGAYRIRAGCRLVSVDRASGATMSDVRRVVQLAEAVVWWRTATGRPGRRVRHVYAAVDCGDVINLDTARAQIEGDHCWPVGGHDW